MSVQIHGGGSWWGPLSSGSSVQTAHNVRRWYVRTGNPDTTRWPVLARLCRPPDSTYAWRCVPDGNGTGQL